MADSPKANDKTLSLVMGLIILGLFFLYLKKSGALETIKETISVLNGGTPRSNE